MRLYSFYMIRFDSILVRLKDDTLGTLSRQREAVSIPYWFD